MTQRLILTWRPDLPEKIRVKIEKIFLAGLTAADPYEVVRKSLHMEGRTLRIDSRTVDLDRYEKILLIAVGKASIKMSQAVMDVCGSMISAGVVISKVIPSDFPESKNIEYHIGNHPLPGSESIASTRRVTDLLQQPSNSRLVIFLISGGGSALLTQPSQGITLDDIMKLNKLLIGCGASIHEINTVRKHIDQVKGGRLLQIASPADTITLILSDVIGDALDVVASGPTVPDSTTFFDALSVLEKYNLSKTSPESIMDVLRRGANGEMRETLKPSDDLNQKTTIVLVGSNQLSLSAAFSKALEEGFIAHSYPDPLTGEAQTAGAVIARLANEAAADRDQHKKPVFWLFGGETTVTLHGNGKGGRNLETCLSAVDGISGLKNVVVATFATDGEDSTTGAAGAWITGETRTRALSLGLIPADFLANNDSYTFFSKIGGLIISGSTGTNVNDLAVAIAY